MWIETFWEVAGRYTHEGTVRIGSGAGGGPGAVAPGLIWPPRMLSSGPRAPGGRPLGPLQSTCEQSVICHVWQSLVRNVVSVGSMVTTGAFFVSPLSTIASPLRRFQ